LNLLNFVIFNSKRMKNLFLVILGIIGLSIVSIAQNDTEFWFVAPEATIAHGDRPIVVRMSTTGNPANVVISQPANGGFAPINVSIAANSSQTVDLTPFIDVIENQPADQVLNYGLKIVSDVAISSYYEVVTDCNCNPEIYALKGKNALGTNFRIPFQNFFSNGVYSPQANSAFIIVATQNNTQITITPSNDIVGHAAGVPFTITLNAGETYTAAQVTENAALNLAGSVVTSNKPIAITIKDDSLSFQGCRDLCGDQIVPVNIVGKEYIVVKGSLNLNDKVYILPTQNNTTINIDGVNMGTFNLTDNYEHNLTNPSMYITTSQPVYVLHYTGFGCELGSALVPPLNCTGSNSVSIVRTTAEYFGLVVFTKSGNENSFTLNGNASLIPAASFNPVPGTSGNYVATLISFNTTDVPVGSTSVISNNAGLFHMGIINGGASTGCRYGFFSDFSGVGFTSTIQSQISCFGGSNGSIDLSINGGLPPFTYLWNNGDTVQDPQNLSTGTYSVTITDIAGCVDSAQIFVPEPPQMALNPDQVQNISCFGGSNGFISVIPSGGTQPYSVIWSNNQSGNSINNLLPGNYSVTYIDANNCDTLTLDFSLTQPAQIPLSVTTNDNLVCPGQSTNITATGAQSYSWSPSNSLNSSTGSTVTASPTQTTTYQIIATDANGCKDSTQITIQFRNYNGDLKSVEAQIKCFGEVLLLAVNGNPANVDSLIWDLGDGNTFPVNPAAHTYAQNGNYIASITLVDNNGCDTTASVNVTIDDSFTLDKINIPNILTVNGDGLNDILVIDPAFAECNDYEIKIFNRWGNLIFKSNNNNPIFEGKNKSGGFLTPGTYFYILEGEKYAKKGTIQIVN